MCFTLVTHTHTRRRYLCGAVRAAGWRPYPRWSVLYPSARHFLLVDDVHELHSVVALHVHHRSLQGILGHLVELRKAAEAKQDNVRIQVFDLDIYVSHSASDHANPFTRGGAGVHPGKLSKKSKTWKLQSVMVKVSGGPSTPLLLLCILPSHLLAGICNLESPRGEPRSSTFDVPL